LNLNPLQRDIMAAVLAGRRLIAIRAGWASGKTSGIALALGALNEMRGGGHAGWVMDNYRRAGRVSIPACRDWLEPQGWASTDSGFLWTAPNGGSVRLVNYYTSAGADGSGLEGVNWGVAAIDECQDLPPSSLTRVFGRTGRDGSGHRVIIMAGLPVHDAWWERAARDHPKGCVIHATSAANRANLPEGWAEEMRHTVSAARYEAMINNRPMPPEGQVYSMFVPEEWPGGNLLGDFDPRGRDCWVAADFGVRRPAAALVASCSARGVDVIVDDVQPDGVSVYEYADAVAARIEHHGMRVARVVGDPAGNQRSAANPQLATQPAVGGQSATCDAGAIVRAAARRAFGRPPAADAEYDRAGPALHNVRRYDARPTIRNGGRRAAAVRLAANVGTESARDCADDCELRPGLPLPGARRRRAEERRRARPPHGRAALLGGQPPMGPRGR
jgi:hypothetical protein